MDPFDDIVPLKSINAAYIDSRYPGDMGLLPDVMPSLKEAATFIEFTEMVYSTIKVNLQD